MTRSTARGDLVAGTPAETLVDEKKAKPGEAWKANEEHIVPHNNIPLVFCALMLTLFLVRLADTWIYPQNPELTNVLSQAALDQTM